MIVTTTVRRIKGIARDCYAVSSPLCPQVGLRASGRTKWFGVIAGVACLATVVSTSAVSAQKKRTPKEISEVTGLIVMTPNGPATCSTWVEWRSPTADPVDTAAIEYWAEGYLSGLAAGSRHDVIGAFRHDALATWLTNYCTANPTTPLPEAIVNLGLAMLAHPDGKL
jgi:hypothetical protein